MHAIRSHAQDFDILLQRKPLTNPIQVQNAMVGGWCFSYDGQVPTISIPTPSLGLSTR
jgi:hypothetical protein